VLDVVREIIPPFNPTEVVDQFCALMKQYRISRASAIATPWPGLSKPSGNAA
jgi:hypothetical protein